MKLPNLSGAMSLMGLTFAACATRPAMASPEPPNYQAGYMHGCDTGISEAENPYCRKQDDWPLYQTDATYRPGWGEGRQARTARYNVTR